MRPMSVPERFRRLARTVIRLHPAQILFRPVHVARTRVLSRWPTAAQLLAGSPTVQPAGRILSFDGSLSLALPGIGPEIERADRALEGHVELVGCRIPVRPPRTDFLAPDVPKLIRYQLNYLGVVRSLAVAARTAGFAHGPAAARLACAHARELVERIPPGRGDAWEPYVVATRLLNLLLMRELLRPVSAGAEREYLEGRLLASLGQHARWLFGTLELHLLGNHLFTDGAALFVAGCALDLNGAALFREVGRAIVARSLAVDVLSDGGHAERSPMYQAFYLDQLELVLAAARASGTAEPAGAREAAARMAAQLVATAHPDGDLPLFGDSVLAEAPLPGDLAAPFGLGADSLRRRLFGDLGRAVRVDGDLVSFPATGWHVSRGRADHLVVDAGPLGTRDQPGHAHSDALSFELSHRGRRLIVDGGAGHYENDEARAYFRGPFAHSAVSVGGEGPDELWASFRAGARATVAPVVVTRVGSMRVFQGTVRAAAGWRAERLLLHAPGELLAAFDRVERVEAGAEVLSHLLWAPEVRLAAQDDVTMDVEPSGGPVLSLRRLAGRSWRARRGELKPFRGFSSSRMGRFEPSDALEIVAEPWGGAWKAAWALLLCASAHVEPNEAGALLVVSDVRVRVQLDEAGLSWKKA